jgi:signal transduction histidine kinase
VLQFKKIAIEYFLFSSIFLNMSTKRLSPFSIFYLVFGYIIVFSVWWAFLLYNKNETAFHEKVELNKIGFEAQYPNLNYYSSNDYEQLNKKYSRQKTMILLEGSVFIILLTIGLLVVRRILFKEIRLAEMQRNFMLSVTHELKSPLASIKLNMQTISSRNLDKAQSERLINNSLFDITRLDALIDNILFASKMENGNSHMTPEDIDVSSIAALFIKKYSSNSKNIKWESDIDEAVIMKTDVSGFSSMINNLLENAVKYSEPGSSATFSLHQKNGKVYIAVADQGYGIPEAERDLVFQKFYRIGSENTRNSKGTGLGLYIVKRFVDYFNGEITIQNNFPKGTVFSIVFPLQPNLA